VLGSAHGSKDLKTLGASASDGTVYVERSMRSAQIFADLDQWMMLIRSFTSITQSWWTIS
jgi:hypothetical protein